MGIIATFRCQVDMMKQTKWFARLDSFDWHLLSVKLCSAFIMFYILVKTTSLFISLWKLQWFLYLVKTTIYSFVKIALLVGVGFPYYILELRMGSIWKL